MIEEGRTFPEPDRRYWRRRVNRHVRKARRTRVLLRWAGILAANLAIGAILVAFGASVARHFATSTELSVKTIDVEGVLHTNADSVRAVLRPYVGRNLVELDLDEVAKAATKDPWVKEATVKRVLPGVLRVSVTERTPGALALLRGMVYVVDDGGFVMGPVGPDFPYDLPLLTGLDRFQGEALGAALARGVGLLMTLHRSRTAWARGISELDLSQPDRVAVSRVDDTAEILLDPDDVDRNLDAYLALKPMIARKVGPGGRVDLRWNRRISILPAAEPPAMESD
ncbi:MAG TPA: FtsQ-type POTRA domain-containing protein [Candidatus Polarisedimenticolaceae bacterium]|nr:FtsQ-type POTRA domain-containing protein [Candidatus Polarisedimenticolaceae bacterium]